MVDLGTVWNWISIFFIFLWNRFIDWIYIFIAPLKNLEMLWIIVPIWINWFFTEFFQEKKGTSMGNAVTNGGVMAWVGVDWIRYMIRIISEDKLDLGLMTYTKFFLSFLIIGIGIFIIVQGVKVKEYVHFLGRVRETSYLLIMISPIIYGVVEPSWNYLISIFLYAPLFYFLIEWIDIHTPDPETYEDNKDEKKDDFINHSLNNKLENNLGNKTMNDPFNMDTNTPNLNNETKEDPFKF